MADIMNITILDDGTIKLDTDKVSAPNHMNAESFFRQVAILAGGDNKRTRKGPKGPDVTKTITKTQGA